MIATYDKGNSGVINPGVNGYLVNNNNHNDISKLILKLKNTPDLLKSLSNSAKTTSRKTYSIADMVLTFQNILTSCSSKS